MGCARLAGGVADGLDIVSVGVTNEGAVVGVVIFGPKTRLVQDFCAVGDGCLEERLDRISRGGLKGDVRLPEAFAGLLTADPEVGGVGAVSDGATKVEDTVATQRRTSGRESFSPSVSIGTVVK